MAKRKNQVEKKTTIGPDEFGRYYYKDKAGHPSYNLKSPLNEDELENYVEITRAEWDELVAPRPLTAEELAAQAEEERKAPIRAQIAAKKAELAATDYQALKYFENWLSAEEYAPIKAHRQELRDEINALEAQL